MSNEITYCAEIGSNHSGSLDLALAHIRAAKEAGATAVKFQLFRSESLDSRPEVQEKLRPYELPLRWLSRLSNEAHTLNLQFGVTPFAIDLVEPLKGLVDFVKISAYDLTFDDLVSEAAKLYVPVVLSTAMATWEEITWAVQSAWTANREIDLVLLHGVAQYPSRLKEQNLTTIKKITDLFVRRSGLSDHTLGHEAAMLAVALGATWIEKHFRVMDVDASRILPNNWTGPFTSNPDWPVSADPFHFAMLVGACTRAHQALGTGSKDGPLPCEQELYATARRTNEKRLRG